MGTRLSGASAGKSPSTLLAERELSPAALILAIIRAK
jgi:hypothetical protein